MKLTKEIAQAILNVAIKDIPYYYERGATANYNVYGEIALYDRYGNFLAGHWDSVQWFSNTLDDEIERYKKDRERNES